MIWQFVVKGVCSQLLVPNNSTAEVIVSFSVLVRRARGALVTCLHAPAATPSLPWETTSPEFGSVTYTLFLAMEEEHQFHIEKVSPIWLVTALVVVPFGLYQLLNFLSPLIHRLTAMKISEVRSITRLSELLLRLNLDLCVPDQIAASGQGHTGRCYQPWLQARSYKSHTHNMYPY